MFCPLEMACQFRAIRAVTIRWAFRRMLDRTYGCECNCNRVRQRALHEYRLLLGRTVSHARFRPARQSRQIRICGRGHIDGQSVRFRILAKEGGRGDSRRGENGSPVKKAKHLLHDSLLNSSCRRGAGSSFVTRCSLSRRHSEGFQKRSTNLFTRIRFNDAAVTVHVDGCEYPTGMPNEPDGVILPEERHFRNVASGMGLTHEVGLCPSKSVPAAECQRLVQPFAVVARVGV